MLRWRDMRAVGRSMPPKCKTPHFPTPRWFSSVEFGITGYYDPNQLRHVGSQDTDLSCHVPIFPFCLLHCVITIHQRYIHTDRQTDGQTDGQTDVMLAA